MAPGQTKIDLLQTRGERGVFPPGSNWARRSVPMRVAAALWLVLPNVVACTQNLIATETSTGEGGSSSATCAGQECGGSGSCCANFECKDGRCTAKTYTAGPGQVCTATSDCMPLFGLTYTCESVENTKLCLSPKSVVGNGNKCQVSADCSSLNCEDGICKAGATTCGVSGSPCISNGDCCANQCGPDHTCINVDPTCRVVGDSCNPTTPDCCYPNSCSKIGSIHRCVATFSCRGPHDVCGEVNCCQGASCIDNRCAELTSCTPRDNPCDESREWECCSKQCALVNGARICVALDGCQPIGDKCVNHGDCCSKSCDLKKRQCMASSSCGAEGEPCFDRPCCPGESGKSMVCTPDALHVKRCTNQTACVGNREKCSFGSQCCDTARCDYDTSLNAFACNKYCRDLGDYCSQHSECCANYCSPLNTCADVARY